MPTQIDAMQYQKSPLQAAYPLKESFAWGQFVRYIELGDDGFALRQVDRYESGHLTRYDRRHWDDQFGSLADFRFGQNWKKHWGEPHVIGHEEFERLWRQAESSPPFATRNPSPVEPAPWITLFESGRWKGQP